MLSEAEARARESIAYGLRKYRKLISQGKTGYDWITVAYGEIQTLRKFCPKEQYDKLSHMILRLRPFKGE